MKIYKDKQKTIEICTVNDWFNNCPPANPKKQWVDKRSALEMARFWIDSQKQNDFLAFLQKVKKDISFDYAIPEIATKFDPYRNPRKNDLLIYANDKNDKILVSIEGKSDEPFGDNYVYTEWIESLLEKRATNESKKMERLIGLYNRFDNKAEFLELRYQLTYWLAGAIEEAIRNKIVSVFLIVQEFHSDITKNQKITLNASDFDYFFRFISNDRYQEVSKNEIRGPIRNKYTKEIDLYVGKYTIDL
jgi:hypothetical protein